MRLLFISDTHNQHRSLRLPEADILIHCGDISGQGRLAEVVDFLDWYGSMPHRHKVLIAGNHDFLAEQNPTLFKSLIPQNVIYLNDSGCEIQGLRIWGSPISPWFFDWAFNRQRGTDIRQHWDLIPLDTEILITHGPPYGILDEVAHDRRRVGCQDLRTKIESLNFLKIHAFGHIHEGYGQHEEEGKLFLNASVLDEHYVLKNAPWVWEVTR